MSDLVKNPEARFSQNEAHTMVAVKNKGADQPAKYYLCYLDVFVCLIGLRLYAPVNSFSVISGHFPRLNQH